MTIIVDATDPRAVTIETFNDGETLATTPDLIAAVDEAASTAEAREAVVRVIIGDRLSSVSIATSPRALRFKVRMLQLVIFLLRHLIGMPELVRLLDEVAETGNFPARNR
jgi:hypothetical protein